MNKYLEKIAEIEFDPVGTAVGAAGGGGLGYGGSYLLERANHIMATNAANDLARKADHIEANIRMTRDGALSRAAKARLEKAENLRMEALHVASEGDAFRAALKKVTPKAIGGLAAGGALLGSLREKKAELSQEDQARMIEATKARLLSPVTLAAKTEAVAHNPNARLALIAGRELVKRVNDLGNTPA